MRTQSLVFLLSLAAGCHENEPGPAMVASLSGEELAKAKCASCHDPDGDGSYSGGTDSVVEGGMVFAANLSPDPNTGLGEWSEKQMLTAIQSGIDDEGLSLCSTMPRWRNQLTDDEALMIVDFLRSLKPIDKEIPESMCD